MKDSVNENYTNVSRKWTHFGWFLLGIVLLAGIGYATTVNENGLFNTPRINATIINEVYYIDVTNGTDVFAQIRSALNAGYKNIKTNGRSAIEYEASSTLTINTADVYIDLNPIYLVYTGTGNIVEFNASRINFKFNRIFNEGGNIVNNGLVNLRCIECRITGNILGSGTANRNFTNSAILINNTENSGEVIWDIGSIYGSNSTPHGIHIADSAFSYEGDVFRSKWLLGFKNTSIQIGEGGISDIEYHQFEVALDNYPGTTPIYIESYGSKSVFIIKEVVRPVSGYDIAFRGSSRDNIALAPMMDFKYLDSSGLNGVFSPNTTISNFNILKNTTTFRPQADGSFIIIDPSRSGSYLTLDRGGGQIQLYLDSTNQYLKSTSNNKPLVLETTSNSNQDIILRSNGTINHALSISSSRNLANITTERLTIGKGSAPSNITLTAQGGAEWCVSINSSGSLITTSGIC